MTLKPRPAHPVAGFFYGCCHFLGICCNIRGMSDENEHRDELGKFKPGNKFWLARSSHGPNPKFSNPEQLWDACCEYFEWVEANPLYEDKIGFYEGSASHEPVEKMRAMTLSGLCFFLRVSCECWAKWRKERPDLVGVIQEAEQVIRDQKFSGAAAGLLNSNIIARDLGLTDKSAMQTLDKDGAPTDPVGADAMALSILKEMQKAIEGNG